MPSVPPMRESLTLVIAGDAAELSPNKRLHHHARGRLVKKWRERADWYWEQAGCRFIGERVVIAFTVRRGRVQDADNCAGSGALKALCDGLKGKAFAGDDAAHVRFEPVAQETGKAWGRSPEVVVVIRSDEEAVGHSKKDVSRRRNPQAGNRKRRSE